MSGDLFTAGYEGLVLSQLLDILVAAKVGTVLDVRAVPLSRRVGFSKTLLGASLAARGIGYLHDRRLGTPKPGRQAARRGRTAEMRAVFAVHMTTGTALDGLADAVTLASHSPTCLLCFERDPHDCHRQMIATMIRDRTGQTIRHL